MRKFFRDVYTNKELRRKIVFTIFILLVYRILSNIPLPGIDMEIYQQQFSTPSEASYLLSIFTGGLLDTPSIVGLGLAAYINASIIIQLLSSVIPKLEELSQDGARGKKILDQYTRYLTVPIALMYSIGYLIYLSQSNLGTAAEPRYLVPVDLSVQRLLFMAMILTAGSLILMWFAELITENGIGNGSSLMIMFGILSSLPALVSRDLANVGVGDAFTELFAGDTSYLSSAGMIALYVILIGAVVLIACIVFMTESTRKVKIQYASRERGGNVRESFLPLKLNQSGVMPIIFASALLTSPRLIIPLLSRVLDPSSPMGQLVVNLQNSFLFDSRSTAYSVVYFVLIVFFSIFYAFIAFKPADVADNLQKSGAFIPGIRPGKTTEEYITRVLLRLTVVGAIFLGLIALVPIAAGSLVQNISGQTFAIFTGIGGTSILIVVGVVLDTVRQINSVRATQSYEKYI